MHPTTPTTQPLPGITRGRFSLIRVRSPLLTESQLFSLPAGTEMFHFPTFPPTGLYIQPAVTPMPEDMHGGLPHSEILVSNARLSTPPGLSQIPTSFIGSYYQGIHRAPFPTYPTTNPNRADGRISHNNEQTQQPHHNGCKSLSHRYDNHKPTHPTGCVELT